MSFSSIADMLSAAQERAQPLYAVIRDADCLENGYDAAASHRQIAALWAAMQASSRQYCADDRSNSGLIGGDAEKLRAAAEKGLLLGGTYFQRVTEQALKVAECNACMKRIVAAPTAGSCGVLPAVLLYLQDKYKFTDEKIAEALSVAGLLGCLIKRNASVSGAECGCQAEIGSACSMAAAAMSQLMGLSIQEIEYSAEIAMEHHLGLTCDPICGLVQIPCIERNAVAAARALDANSYANLSDGHHMISYDRVVEVMKETGKDIPSLYRETSEGGLARNYTQK